jgi:hypothetical protein
LPSSALKGREILIILTIIRFYFSFYKTDATKERGAHQGTIRTGGWAYKIVVNFSLLPQFMQYYCVQMHLDAKRPSTAL